MLKAYFIGLMLLVPGAEARGEIGAPMFLSMVDADKNGSISLAEVRQAAGKRYDLLKARNGKVAMLDVSGRLSEEEFVKARRSASQDKDTLSRSDFIDYAASLFEAARNAAQDHQDTLNAKALTSEQGKKLIVFLE